MKRVLKFEKRNFDIMLDDGTKKTVSGYVYGVWGVWGVKRGSVTHIPTGLRIIPSKTITRAKEALNDLLSIAPELEDETDANVFLSDAYRPLFLALRAKYLNK